MSKQNRPFEMRNRATVLWISVASALIYAVFAVFIGAVANFPDKYSGSLIAAAVAFLITTPLLSIRLVKPFVNTLHKRFIGIYLCWPVALGDFFARKILGVLRQYLLLSGALTAAASGVLFYLKEQSLLSFGLGALFGFALCAATTATVLVSISVAARYHSPPVAVVCAFLAPLLLGNVFANSLREYALIPFFATALVLVAVAAAVFLQVVRYLNVFNPRSVKE
ncbi:MAG: hypothetical protein Q4C71_05415 [Microbacteriaceae bacterium]|nr:hypothetical protein [Microbacteriaceae bacterium]